MKVLILTSETPANVWLVNQILGRHDVVGIVIERRPLAATGAEKLARRRRMVERYGWLRTVNKLLYNRMKSRYLAESEARTVLEGFFADETPVQYARSVPTLVVADINHFETVRFIREKAADVLAVCGTTVLKPDVFTLTPLGAINIHTGITPEYRSAEPIFWALYHGEPEKVGVTIHYIDRGIDTGAIIHQESVPVHADDSLPAIYVRCIRRGAELYSRALGEIQDGSVRTMTKTGVTSRAFLSIDLGLVQYLLFRWRFWRLAARLPRREPVPATVPEAQR
jgi:folate-dependent phosphoribosylglycinamide formyltransferase PurN